MPKASWSNKDEKRRGHHTETKHQRIGRRKGRNNEGSPSGQLPRGEKRVLEEENENTGKSATKRG